MLRTTSRPEATAARARRRPASTARSTAGSTDPARPFAHPGRAAAPRILDAVTPGRTRELRIALPPGANVGAALHALLDGWPPYAGCGRLVGGAFSQVQYHVMVHAAQGVKPYVYGPPIVCAGESTLIGAAINVGHRADGSRILHAHGGFVDEHGLQHGGHLALEQTIAAGDGVRVHLCLFDGVDLVVSPDAETTFDLLQPARNA
ncbi:hypothetical protein CY652_17185 [Burkholderia sp. WAC0059]|uniref:hypothetical protein n=1 Tax=Burkholderia sp. WAC0059 TaxID=2066022 RepID=UPI000C7F4C21|nr:hypothetical protein [Burkholderia sp. WAC0059]PLZ01274.1 hypothetical protein CY652_17185 [Burkholderia sp. WAC0059]